MRYIILDTETGGIGLDKSLLTAYFLVCDDKFNFINELYLYIKPDDGIYRVTGEAMEINKINLVEHDKKAVTYKKAGTMLYDFIQSNYISGKDHLVPVGHGMSGDLDHIFDKLVSRRSWETFVSYRRFDTSVVAQFLLSCGIIPRTVSGSLQSLCEHYKINTGDGFHDAKFDVLRTSDVLQKMIGEVQNWNG